MFAQAKPKKFNTKNTHQSTDDQLMTNHKFESASGLLRKNSSQLRQTKLSLNKTTNTLQYDGFISEENLKPRSKQIFAPTDYKMLNQNCCAATTKKRKVESTVSGKKSSSSPLAKPGRNLISLIGRVDFCLKMHKLHSQLNMLWNIYGKLLRIIAGENNEHTLLLRNDNRGPILQSIYHDYGDELKTLDKDCYLHVIGHFVGVNRLQTFKIEQVSIKIWQQNFLRLENVTSYVLMQYDSIQDIHRVLV